MEPNSQGPINFKDEKYAAVLVTILKDLNANVDDQLQGFTKHEQAELLGFRAFFKNLQYLLENEKSELAKQAIELRGATRPDIYCEKIHNNINIVDKYRQYAASPSAELHHILKYYQTFQKHLQSQGGGFLEEKLTATFDSRIDTEVQKLSDLIKKRNFTKEITDYYLPLLAALGGMADSPRISQLIKKIEQLKKLATSETVTKYVKRVKRVKSIKPEDPDSGKSLSELISKLKEDAEPEEKEWEPEMGNSKAEKEVACPLCGACTKQTDNLCVLCGFDIKTYLSKKTGEKSDVVPVPATPAQDAKPEAVNVNESGEAFECLCCGSRVKMEETTCPKCGAEHIDKTQSSTTALAGTQQTEQADKSPSACPECGELLNPADESCPTCGFNLKSK